MKPAFRWAVAFGVAVLSVTAIVQAQSALRQRGYVSIANFIGSDGVSSGDINMTSHDILAGSLQSDNAGVCAANDTVYDINGVITCYPSADTVPAALVYKSRSAWPAATVNTTGSDLVLAPGQGSTRITVSNNANCGAGDTITVTINGTANVLTRGTQWTEGANAAATCTAVRTAVIALAGIDATATTCNSAELDIYRNANGYDVAVATNDATCFTVVNGTDGQARVFGSLTVTGSITSLISAFVTSNVFAQRFSGLFLDNGAADTGDTGLVRIQNGGTLASGEANPTGADGTIIYTTENTWAFSSPVAIGTLAFASLGTPSNGAMAYCSDCNKATPCTSGGGGAIAKRIAGAWDCN